MNWNSPAEFWAMGGYGLYVWGSYGITLALVVAELVSLKLRRGNLRRVLRSRNRT